MRYRLELEGDIQALRLALKVMWRRFGLRCRRVEEIPRVTPEQVERLEAVRAEFAASGEWVTAELQALGIEEVVDDGTSPGDELGPVPGLAGADDGAPGAVVGGVDGQVVRVRKGKVKP